VKGLTFVAPLGLTLVLETALFELLTIMPRLVEKSSVIGASLSLRTFG